MTRVAGLYRLEFIVPDLGAAEDFYLNHWAMEPVADRGDSRRFRSLMASHADLVLRRGETARLGHVGFSVKSEQDLDALAGQLERGGFALTEAPHRSDREEEARVAAVNDPDGNRVELIVPSASASTRPPSAATIGPKRLGHVVLWTPQQQALETFYGALGFQVTDRTHMGMSFLRCNTDHHSVALVHSRRGRTGLQHAAFDVGSIDDVMREYGRLRGEGVECIWGVGRHGPGNNIFSYYLDPAGNVVEFYGEMEDWPEQEHVEPRHWGPEHRGDIWGVAGAPPMPFRE